MRIAIITAGWRKDGVKNVIKQLEKQTYKDWTEHIIVNDNSLEVRELFKDNDYFQDDPKRFCIDSYIRGGYYGAHARSAGIVMALHHLPERIRKDDEDWWIMLWDDDNDFAPDFLERMVKAHQEHPEAVLLGASIHIKGKIDKNYAHTMKNVIAGQNTDLGAFLYKKEMFDKYGYFPASLRYKITYDWEQLKKIAEGEKYDWKKVLEIRKKHPKDEQEELLNEYDWYKKIYIDNSCPGLIFYHKER